MTFSERLKIIQNLPLVKRKIIFWSIIIILGLIICSLYVIDIRNKIKTFPMEESLERLNLPNLKEGLEEIPKFETKEIDELKK